MSARRPVILGYDAVSPLGVDLDAQWRRAKAGESGIGRLTRFPVTPNFPVGIAGEVAAFDESAYTFLAPRAMAHWTSPVFKHALLVVHRALQKIGLEITPELAPRVAITFSTAIGGLDVLLDADREWVKRGKLPHPFMNPNSCINMAAGKISILTGATGPIVSTITACATGCTSLIVGALFLDAGMADIVICGAVDFPLVESIVAGFATMNGAFKTVEEHADTPPPRASRPFSLDRHGFIVSEGAGCLILATKEFAQAHGFRPAVELAGWSSTADAHHFVAPNLATVARCIAEAVAHAGLQPSDIDAVNAHAASTKVGDQVEFEALRQVFGERIPPVSANKSQIGHAMGASSAIESIFAQEGMQTNVLLPTINYAPDPKIPLDCVAEGARTLSQEHVLKNSFGFGGCNACLVFRRID
jgi:3-oxoacyl-[acyl-carrier-protein] synthase II